MVGGLKGNRSARAVSLALAIAVVLGGFALGSFTAVGADEPAIGSETPQATDAMRLGIAEAASPESAPAMTRDEIRAWVDGLGFPERRLDVVDRTRAGVSALPDGSGVIGPDDADENAIHRADAAHALGFDGTGVRVAVIDTGVDLAHPDLFNVTARVTDAASPYFLHPIAYTGGSLNDYLLAGEPSPSLPGGGNEGANSWWVNTSFSTTVVAPGDGTQHVAWTDGSITLTWDVTGETGLSAGEEVRIGFHPDDKLLRVWGTRAGVLLFNSGPGGGVPYDRIMVDLDVDWSFVGEKRAWMNTDWATFDPTAELITKDLDLDGVADLSGGMVTFISDGVREIPYAARQIDVLNLTFQTRLNDNTFDLWADLGIDPTANLVPAAGDLVVLFGDFDLDISDLAFGSHGTWVTSAIVGQGITGGGAVGPVLSGMAPGAKIIGAGNNFDDTDPLRQEGLFTSLLFAAEGYDGVVGTGDEAHIASNSWGGLGWAGWEWDSRWADYVSTVLSGGRTAIVFGVGNAGPGYGARHTPSGGAGLIVSSSMENGNYRVDPWFAAEGGPNPASGDVTGFSSRGPSALGRHHVDALTTGRSGYGADALNDNPFVVDSGLNFDGSSSWILWAGTSLSTPNLSGILALIYDAYMAAHGGTAPLAATAKTILKNSADDAHQDPFAVGAGTANALRGVLIANETDGLSLSLDEWYPGDYRGVNYSAYPNLLFPGDSDVVTVDMTNHRPSAPMTVEVEDAVIARVGSVFSNFTRSRGAPANQFLLNESGLWVGQTLTVPTPAGLFTTADVLRVSMWFDRARLGESLFYALRLVDWTDVDGDGLFDGFAEENLLFDDWISITTIRGPNGVGYVYDPANRTHDGLIIIMDPQFDAFLGSPITLTLRVDYYKRTDFGWLDIVGGPSFLIPAASTSTADLSVTVPGDADPGLYEAVVLFKLDDGNVTTLPVVANVAMGAVPASYGGNAADAGIYQQGVQHGAAMGDDSATGDYRYYFLDLDAPTNVTFLLGWDEAASDHELYVLSNGTNWFSENAPLRYGPGGMDLVALKTIGANGTSVVAPLREGLSILVSRSTFLAGLAVEEHPVGEAGVITVTPSPWIGTGIPVVGAEVFTITSELAFTDVTGTVETGSVLLFTDEPVDPYPCTGACSGAAFVQYLFGAPNKIRTDVPPGIQRADYTLFFHSGARDVDMGIFWDANCDGVYAVTDDVIGTVASTLRNPEIGRIFSPASGCYWVHAAGFDVDAGSLYDLTVDLISAPFATFAILPPSIDPGTPANVTVSYSLPLVAQTSGGTIFVGSAQFPQAIPIRVALTPDLPPMFSNPRPIPNSALNDASPTISVDMMDWPDAFETAVDPGAVEVLLDGADFSSFAAITPVDVTLPLPFPLAEGTHTVIVTAADLNGSASSTTWRFDVDTVFPFIIVEEPTVPITNDPNVVISGQADPSATLTVNGTAVFVSFFGKFTTNLTLSDGVHVIELVATDAAGNRDNVTVRIEVDTVAPALDLTSPADGTTTGVASVTVAGTTEPGVSLEVNGIGIGVDTSGGFSVLLALTVGANAITVTATDLAGNTVSRSATVTFESSLPGLEQSLDAANAALASLQTLVLVLAGVVAAMAGLAAVGFFLWWRARKTA